MKYFKKKKKKKFQKKINDKKKSKQCLSPTCVSAYITCHVCTSYFTKFIFLITLDSIYIFSTFKNKNQNQKKSNWVFFSSLGFLVRTGLCIQIQSQSWRSSKLSFSIHLSRTSFIGITLSKFL